MKTLTVKTFAKLMNGLLHSKQIKPTDEIYLSSDEEGNSFCPLMDDTKISIAISKGATFLRSAKETPSIDRRVSSSTIRKSLVRSRRSSTSVART